jgi:hypothetical protein
MPNDDCDSIEIDCRSLEKCLRKLRPFPAGCKLDEGRKIKGRGKGYVFRLIAKKKTGKKKKKN